MRKHAVLVFIIVALFCMESCGPKPFACFVTEPEEDNIHVGDTVTFRAACSTNAHDYFWEFYDKDDSTDYGFMVKRVFNQPGEVKVFLLITGKGKTSSTERYIEVKP